MSEEQEMQIIRSDKPMTEVKGLVLVPDGTLCFCRPVMNGEVDELDNFVITGLEIVWLRPNKDGIWEGIGPISGHVYRHVSWLHKQMAQQQALEHMRELHQARRASWRWRLRFQLWRLGRYWRGAWSRVRSSVFNR